MKKWLIIILIGLSLFACGDKKDNNKKSRNRRLIDRRKPMSWGRPQTIYVFADDNIWKYAQEKLNQTIERTIYTTRNEKMFELERVEFNQLEDFYKFNNLIFYCDASSPKAVSEYVKERLGEKIDSELSANGAALFPAFNLWADDQMVLFITGETEPMLLKLNILQADKIYNLFKDRLYKRMEYKTFRGKLKSEANFTDQIWSLDLPDNFKLFKSNSEDHFVSYLSRIEDKPDRYIAVYHQDMKEDILNRRWLVNKRNEVFGKYYEGDHFEETDVMSSAVTIGSHQGIKLMGRWQNDQYAMGGAFACYAFYSQELQKVFLVDTSVYYPAGDKLPALIELEIISNSIQLK